MKRIVILLLSALPLCSCIRDISLDAGERAVVVHCILSDAPVQELKLYTTRGSSQPSSTYVSDAVVTLTDLTESDVVGLFEYVGDGLWTLEYSAVPGHEYHLKVDIPGQNIMFASQTMPDLVIAEYTGFYSYKDSVDGWQYQRGVSYRIKSSSPVWVCGVNYYLDGARYTMVEEICTNQHSSVDYFNLLGSQYSSKETYLKDEKCQGYLYPMLSGSSLHKRYIRVRRPDYSHEYCFSGNFAGERDMIKPNPSHSHYDDDQISRAPDIESFLLFTAVSEDYDHYLKEMTVYLDQLQSSELSSIYQREDFYTNIVGGIGIFGAMLERSEYWYRAYSPENDPKPSNI